MLSLFTQGTGTENGGKLNKVILSKVKHFQIEEDALSDAVCLLRVVSDSRVSSPCISRIHMSF